MVPRRVTEVKHAGTHSQTGSTCESADYWQGTRFRGDQQTDARSRVNAKADLLRECQNREGGNGVCNTGGTVADKQIPP